MAGRRDRIADLPVWKVAPEMVPGAHFQLRKCSNVPFGPKVLIFGPPGGIPEDSVASAPAPIPAPTPAPAPSPAPSPSLNLDFDRNLSLNLNRQPLTLTINTYYSVSYTHLTLPTN